MFIKINQALHTRIARTTLSWRQHAGYEERSTESVQCSSCQCVSLAVWQCAFLQEFCKRPVLGEFRKIAEHAYFICLSGLILGRRSNKSGFVSFINMHARAHTRTNEDLSDCSVGKDEQWRARDGESERQRGVLRWLESRRSQRCC